jgi:sugar O-acyltransferase (sialic acid O-acetyltransferase NeuD family)
VSCDLVIIGAGGFGREVADIVEAIDRHSPTFDLLGFVDDGHPDPDVLARRGTPHLGTTHELVRWPGARYAVAVADPVIREELDGRARAAGLRPARLVHPTTAIGADVREGPGLITGAHTSITTNIDIGQHVHLDRRVTVGHDSRIGDFVTVHPGATISGDVTVGSRARIGSNAVVIQGVTVGDGATVGAGAAVVRDVAAGQTVVGVPARPLHR